MTMTIEKIEFPRRETKQSKPKKSLSIDSEDETFVSNTCDQIPDPVVKRNESFENPIAAIAVINEIISSIQGDFGKYLLEDGKSRATIESYMGDIRKFLEWLENKQGTFEGQLSRVSITSYRNKLEEENYAVNTINKKINSLHSFNHYLIREGFCEKLVSASKDGVWQV